MEAPPEVTIPELSKEFVSKLFGRKVASFEIKAGTAPGDNYMSVLYCIKAILDSPNKDGKVEVIYAISKCFPSHPMRQGFLQKSNVFWNELQIYKEFIPALRTFQEETGTTLRLPFAPIISGESVNFGSGKENEENLVKYAGRVFEPFEIYIMMVDLKNTYGFGMANRLVGLGVDEVSLVMAEHSKLHAISWAYKVKNGLNDIQHKFPYLKFNINEADMEMWVAMMTGNCQMAYDTLKTVENIEPGVLEGISKLKEQMKELLIEMFNEEETQSRKRLDKFMRIKPNYNEAIRKADDVPWKVVVHGDCWVNNLLFRYDPETKKAIELVLIDLQIMREECPTMDLSYLFYTSTTASFRKEYLGSMLRLYHDKFTYYCDQFGVPYLPGFSVESLKRRFHEAKLRGLIMALMVLPIMLKDAKDVQDMETFKKDGDFTEMMDAMYVGSAENNLYKERLLGVVQDMCDVGIL